jgi:NADH dehydrogenase FAD-containing subunit
MPQSNPKVVILGAGFGGLEATKTLARAPVEITLIDRQNYHCFQPLLYQVATAALSPADIAWPIRHILRQQKNATVFMTEVTGIDVGARVVNTKSGPFSFDFLVIATGARNSYFGRDHWAEIAQGLKRIEDATRRRSLPPFRYRHEGSLATIGRRAAVVELGPIQLRGFIGWMFWSAVHIYFLIGIRNRFVVAVTWLWSYLTFKRGARLITEVPPIVSAE